METSRLTPVQQNRVCVRARKIPKTIGLLNLPSSFIAAKNVANSRCLRLIIPIERKFTLICMIGGGVRRL
jgi:hypothetical protein